MEIVRARLSGSKSLLQNAIIAFVAISIVALVLVGLALMLQGSLVNFFQDPLGWLDGMDSSLAFDVVSNGAELLAAILAIAITVVAIVVELAANRYSHRISSLFVREPINIFVMSFFVVATILSMWIALSLGGSAEATSFSRAGLLISILLVTAALVVLLPYFAFVLSFLSPVNVIHKIRNSAFTSARPSDAREIEKSKIALQESVDELQDIARRAADLSDRSVAMASINALTELVFQYQTLLPDFPDDWFHISDSVSGDPDFISLSSTAVREIESDGTWVEVKIMRQYLDLISDSNPSSRDTTYVIAINTRRIGIAAIDYRPQLVELCIHCFNSYLRATINNNDQRTSYYIMNQYRLLAETLLRRGKDEKVQEVALHFQFYGVLGFKARIPFLLEVAAYDLMHLIKKSATLGSPLVDGLLKLLLDLDQEIKEEFHEDSLLGVRRTQIQLATFFLERKDDELAQQVCNDLKTENTVRLGHLRKQLESEERSQYWEFTDRGVNFSYLSEDLRKYLPRVFELIDES